MILNRMLMVMSMLMYRLCLEVQLGIAFCFASVGVDNIRDNLFYLWDISLSKCAEWAKEISRGGRPGRFLDSG